MVMMVVGLDDLAAPRPRRCTPCGKKGEGRRAYGESYYCPPPEKSSPRKTRIRTLEMKIVRRDGGKLFIGGVGVTCTYALVCIIYAVESLASFEDLVEFL